LYGFVCFCIKPYKKAHSKTSVLLDYNGNLIAKQLKGEISQNIIDAINNYDYNKVIIDLSLVEDELLIHYI
jgi:hypothetical protein